MEDPQRSSQEQKKEKVILDPHFFQGSFDITGV